VLFSGLSQLGANGAWRLIMDVDTSGSDTLELRAYIIGLGKKLSETWLYQWKAAA